MSRHEEEENERGFRVVDRRRFTTEGEIRSDAPPERAPPPPPREAEHSESGKTEQNAPQSGIDFMTFVASLATNALAAMGALPPEQSGGLPKSRELAREYIDIIVMLQEKTKGNLKPEEKSALQRVVGDLKLQYVEASRQR